MARPMRTSACAPCWRRWWPTSRFFEAIPGLMERCPACRREVELPRLRPTTAARHHAEGPAGTGASTATGAPRRRADHPASLQRRVPASLPRPRQGIRRRPAQPRRRIEGPGDRRLPALRHDARPPTWTSSAWSAPSFTVAHGVWLDDDDMKRAGRSRRLGRAQSRLQHAAGQRASPTCAACSTPRSMSASAPTAATCSDNQNMYERCGSPRFVAGRRGPDRRQWVTTEEVLEAATDRQRPRARLRHIGRIAPGYKADIVFLDLAPRELDPVNDPVNQLVHTEDGTGVHSVMVGGRSWSRTASS